MSGETGSLVEELAAGEYDYVDIGELHEHPRNAEIYGEVDPDEAFVEDIDRNGIETPLVVNEHEDTQREWGHPNTVIGGHRRLEAAKRAGLNRVPVKWVSYPEPMATLRVIRNNNQRTKSDAQITNEAMVAEEIHRERAAERQGHGETAPGKTLRENFHEASSGRTNDFLAEQIGADVSGRTLGKGIEVQRFAHPEKYVEGKDYIRNPEKYDVPEEVREVARQQVEEMDDGESFHGAIEAVKKARREYDEEQERNRKAQRFDDLDTTTEVLSGDFAEVAEDFEPESFDAIVTDPPYPGEFMECWEDLSEVGSRVLKPGGFCIAYSGSYHLPAVMEALGEHLEYYWQFILKHNGPGQRIWPRNVRNGYKPVLVYQKPGQDGVEKIDGLTPDVFDGSGREKDRHEWQQSAGELEDVLETFTAPNDRVLDPMSGSGTTAAACETMKRRCVAVEVEDEHVETIKARLAEVSG